MEYCFDDLRNILTIKPIVFERNENQLMNSIEYYISCEIFRQITEALNYLHSLKPEALLHRDLKPQNILIGVCKNKRICKLADFGLSKFIKDCSASHTKFIGTPGYSAPEITIGQRYDIKADIYSLGIIGLQIFDVLNNNSNEGSSKLQQNMLNETISENISKYYTLISNKLINPMRNYRITCEEILSEIRILKLGIDKYSIPLNELKLYEKTFTENNLRFFFDIISEDN